MFRDSIEAFLYVVQSGRGVKDVTARVGYLRNGIKHCRVQIECNDGAEYGIDAYGDEADRLISAAKNYPARIELAATT